MELVEIYEGPTLLAEMLAEALRQKGIEAIRQGAEPMLGVLGEMATPPFESVRIAAHDWDQRRDDVESCLMFVRTDPGDPASADEEANGEGV